MKKTFALDPAEREKDCIDHQFYWTGHMPCTGVRKCRMCGLVEPLPMSRHKESDLWHGLNNAIEAHIEWGSA